MSRFQLLGIFLSILIISSCGPSQEDMARVKLANAKSLLQKNDTSAALVLIDSIPVLFPKAIYSVNAAKNLKGEIQWEILQKKENELDSVKITIASLEKNFIKEKTEFDRYTQYIHKRQKADRRWDKSYLQIHLDDRGELFLSSNYFGEQWLDHTGIRVYDGPDQAKTEKIDLGNVNNHRSDFMEAKWEKVSYRKGADNGVIEFIATNSHRRLKAAFLGKRYYYIILEEYDKKAVKQALELSRDIKRKAVLENEIKHLQNSLSIQ